MAAASAWMSGSSTLALALASALPKGLLLVAASKRPSAQAAAAAFFLQCHTATWCSVPDVELTRLARPLTQSASGRIERCSFEKGMCPTKVEGVLCQCRISRQSCSHLAISPIAERGADVYLVCYHGQQ